METATRSAQEGTSDADRHTDVTMVVDGPGQCRAVNEILARVGDKWSMRVILSLTDGRLRFNVLRRTIPAISQRMLTRTLRNLERDGLVHRAVTPSVPPRVDYSLTPLGASLTDPVALLGNWAMENIAAIESARSKFDAREEAC